MKSGTRLLLTCISGTEDWICYITTTDEIKVQIITECNPAYTVTELNEANVRF